MGFRTVRTAAAASSLLLLPLLGAACAGAGEMEQAATDTVTALPDDTTRLTAEQLASLPGNRTQHVPCEDVRAYLESMDDPGPARRINILLEGGELRVTPKTNRVPLRDTIQWRADDRLDWVARFQESSPLADGAMEVRGTGDATSVVTSDSTRCGSYEYEMAAYDTESDSLYVADPVWWVY